METSFHYRDYLENSFKGIEVSEESVSEQPIKIKNKVFSINNKVPNDYMELKEQIHKERLLSCCLRSNIGKKEKEACNMKSKIKNAEISIKMAVANRKKKLQTMKELDAEINKIQTNTAKKELQINGISIISPINHTE